VLDGLDLHPILSGQCGTAKGNVIEVDTETGAKTWFGKPNKKGSGGEKRGVNSSVLTPQEESSRKRGANLLIKGQIREPRGLMVWCRKSPSAFQKKKRVSEAKGRRKEIAAKGLFARVLCKKRGRARRNSDKAGT